MSETGLKKAIPINKKDLNIHRKIAGALMTNGTYTPSLGVANQVTQLFGDPRDTQLGGKFSVGNTLLLYMTKFLPNAETSSPNVSLASYVIQEALTMGEYMNNDQKRLLNIDGANASEQKDYDDKRMSAAAVGLFSLASYALYLLRTIKCEGEEVNFLKEFGGIPEIRINTYGEASKAAMFFLDKYLNKKDYINTEAELIGFLKVYFTELQKLTAQKNEILQADAFFEKNIYQLTDSTFEIRGWEIEAELSTANAVFDRQELADIVGNTRLKNILKRLVIFLLAYDFEREKNPFFEFGGGFSTVVFLHGEPGTGKTMFYRALATLLRDYCEKFGIPYQILDFPKDLVDSFQGKSAQKAAEWFKAYNNPKKITIGGMDDCENVLVDRGGRNASEGSNGIVAVVLTETEGMKTSNHGRAILLGLTNKIGIIDPAVISRMGIVEEVKGPQGAEDFMDQTFLWFKKLNGFGSKIKLAEPKGYSLMSRQDAKEIKTYKKVEEFVDDRELLKMYTDVLAEGHTGYDFIGQMTARFQKRFKRFAGRDMRNIHSAILLRLMDFEMPEEWLEDGAVFLQKPYEEKVAMIQDLIEKSMKNLSFEDIVHEELTNYMNNYVKVGADEASKRVQERVQNLIDGDKAKEEYKAITGKDLG